MTVASEPRLLLALDRARHDAALRGHDRIGTTHLLLGLLGVQESTTLAVLRGLAIDPEAVRRSAERSLPAAGPPTDAAELPYSTNAARVLERATRDSGGNGDAVVRADHVLRALLEIPGEASRILQRAGLTATALPTQFRGAAHGSLANPSFLAVRAAADAPVYLQIVDQVREAVAEGRLRPDERLPTVRQLAAALDIAAGTAARAYQELEQLGVVTTEGSKGTRVARPRAVEVPKMERTATLVGLLRPVAVAAAYMGASADEVRSALEHALTGISPFTASTTASEVLVP
jgi:GntR family transcriptional regulator